MDDTKKTERLLAALLSVDKRLKAAGFHGLSSAFFDVFTQYVASGKRTLVLRKGRRSGGTSSAVQYVAAYLQSVAEVPRGDLGVFVLMSHTLAAGRDVLRRLHEILEACGVEHETTADRIAFASKPLEVRVYAPTFTAVRGITCVGAFVDETAFIKSDSGDSPAQSIIEQALLPAMATIATAPLLLVSSPHGFEDYHAQRYALGESDSPSQTVAHVPSWIGNPELTEAACRELATSETDFWREYAAEPQDSVATRPFPREWIEALEHIEKGEPAGSRVIVTDPSSGRHDSWVWFIAGWNVRPKADDPKTNEAVLCIDIADGAFGAWARVTNAGDVFDRMVADGEKCGAVGLFSDHRDENHVVENARRVGMPLTIYRHQTENKAQAVRRLQMFMEAGQIALPRRNRERIKQQLRNYQQTETRSGLARFAGKGKRPDDFIACLLTLMMADQAGALEGGINMKRRRRRDPPPFSGSPLKSWKRPMGGGSSSPLDRLTFDHKGRGVFGRKKGPLDGGGF